MINIKVYIQIKNEEWNIYRRFSHFYNLNSKLKEKYNIISTISFPKKKTLGNKVKQLSISIK
jgi:sorting nexin-29